MSTHHRQEGIAVQQQHMSTQRVAGMEMRPRSESVDTAVEESISTVMQKRRTFRKLSNASSVLSDIFRPETQEGEIRRKLKDAARFEGPGSRVDTDMIDFLRNVTPPPDNYMSLPDWLSSSSLSDDAENSSGNDGNSKWRKLFWRKKKKTKSKTKKAAAEAAQQKRRRRRSRPLSITLPDTAIAGTTTGGHRHIAISIPLEYAHLTPIQMQAEFPPSPPPSRGSLTENVIESRTGPIRSFVNERGTVTVLRPVLEDSESIASSIRHAASYMFAANNHQSNSGEAITPPLSPPESLIQGRQTPEAEAADGIVTQLEPPSTSPEKPAVVEPSAEPVAVLPDLRPGSPSAKLYYPQRRSSLMVSGQQPALSPTVMHSPMSQGVARSPQRGSFDGVNVPRHSRHLSKDSTADPRTSIADSIVTNGTDPIIADAQAGRRVSMASIVTQAHGIKSNRQSLALSAGDTPARSSLIDGDFGDFDQEPLPPLPRLFAPDDGTEMEAGAGPSSDGALAGISSFDDLHSLLARKKPVKREHLDGTGIDLVPLAEHDSFQADDRRPFTPPERPATSSRLLRSSKHTPPRTLRPATSQGLGLRLTPVMIVADVKPSSPPKSPERSPPAAASPLVPFYAARPHPASPNQISPSSPMTHPSSSGPTPPESPERIMMSTPQKTQEQERLDERVERRPGKRQQQPELQASPEETPQQEKQDQKHQRPFSPTTLAYPDRTSLARRREKRAQRESLTQVPQYQPAANSREAAATAAARERETDIEDRLARLERSGDAWMQAMVPLFERLNKSLARVYALDDDEGAGGAGEGRQRQRRGKEAAIMAREHPGWEDDYDGPQMEERMRHLRRQGREMARAREDRRWLADEYDEIDPELEMMEDVGVSRRRRLPPAGPEQDLYDLEFADDTAQYLSGATPHRSRRHHYQQAQQQRDASVATAVPSVAGRSSRGSKSRNDDRRRHHHHSPFSTSRTLTAGGRSSSAAQSSRRDAEATLTRKSVLQAEFEAEMARRRREEQLAADVDARMEWGKKTATARGMQFQPRAAAAAPREEEYYEPAYEEEDARRHRRRHHRGRGYERSRGHMVDLGGYVTDSTIAAPGDSIGMGMGMGASMSVGGGGLETLEMLMQDLMAGSQLNMDDQAAGGDTSPEGIAEYLFEDF